MQNIPEDRLGAPVHRSLVPRHPVAAILEKIHPLLSAEKGAAYNIRQRARTRPPGRAIATAGLPSS